MRYILKYNKQYILLMTDQCYTKLYNVKGRHSINLKSDFVKDSQFPFSVGDRLLLKINSDNQTIEIIKHQDGQGRDPNES